MEDNYFNKLIEKFENLNDEEYEQLLIDSGIENYPYETDEN